MAKVFSISEVAEHTSRNDCWVILFGKVYNVTTFLDEHPGGDEVLLEATGKDATVEFDSVGHSHEAWAMLEKFYVGELNKSNGPTNNAKISSLPSPDATKKKSKTLMTYFIQFVVPLIILNLVFAFFSKSSA